MASEGPEHEESALEEPTAVPLEDSLDLHAFSPSEIPDLVQEYLRACQEAGLAEVRLIHGRGIGLQRKVVQTLLRRLPFVHSFHDAPAPRGGWGATVVYLRPVNHMYHQVPESEDTR